MKVFECKLRILVVFSSPRARHRSGRRRPSPSPSSFTPSRLAPLPDTECKLVSFNLKWSFIKNDSLEAWKSFVTILPRTVSEPSCRREKGDITLRLNNPPNSSQLFSISQPDAAHRTCSPTPKKMNRQVLVVVVKAWLANRVSFKHLN